MLTVTKAALDRLSKKLASRKVGGDRAFRFTQETGGWRLRPDRSRPDDTTFIHEGKNVLLLDTAVSEAMTELRLHVRMTGAAAKLRLHRATPRSG